MSSFAVTSRNATTASSSSSPSCSPLVPSTLPMDPWVITPFTTANSSFCTHINGSNNFDSVPFVPTNYNVSSFYHTSSYPAPQRHHQYSSFSSDTNKINNDTSNNNSSINNNNNNIGNDNDNNNNNNDTYSAAHLRIKARECMSAIIGTANHTKNHLLWPQGV